MSGQNPRLIAPANVSGGAAANVAYTIVAPDEYPTRIGRMYVGRLYRRSTKCESSSSAPAG
jgi:hypothetical protein